MLDVSKGQKREAVRVFEKKYRNVVVKWQGQVLRVEGDDIDSTDVLDQEIKDMP